MAIEGRTINDVFGAAVREIEHGEAKYKRFHEEMGVGGWLTVMRRELREVEDAFARGDWDDARRELLQATAVGINALRYLGVVERE